MGVCAVAFETKAMEGTRVHNTRHGHLRQFSSDSSNFEVWCSAFERVLKSINRIAYEVLTKAEAAMGNTIEWDDLEI